VPIVRRGCSPDCSTVPTRFRGGRHFSAAAPIPQATLYQSRTAFGSRRWGYAVPAFAGATVGLGLTFWLQPRGLFESAASPTSSPQTAPAGLPDLEDPKYDPEKPLPDPPSFTDPYQLTFGTVCGLVAGVFVKKGLRVVAFIMGGGFLLLQYFNSLHWIRVDWATAERQFNRAFYVTDEGGVQRPPTIATAWKWFIDFVLADFQPRASFIVGFMLGLRFG